MRTRFLDYLAVLAWAAVLGLRLRGVLQSDWLASLLAVQAGLVAWRVVFREQPSVEAGWSWRLFAWASALLPLTVFPGGGSLVPQTTATVVGSVGLVLSLLALVWLGRAFGIAPADRGLVSGGPYRLLRHPAYAGELISLLSYVSLNLSPWNFGVAALLVASIAVRIGLEERILAGYADYAALVRWRVLPGIW